MTKTGLLVMDLQNGIVSRMDNGPEFIGRLQNVMTIARAANIPIIYVVVRFRPQFPEVSSRNKVFNALKTGGISLQEGDPITDIHIDLWPKPNDIIVTKRRVGAFSGSDLEIVLRSLDIEHLVLTGISTSGVVLSTLRLASDMDYKITVLADCCFDKDPEVQKVLMEKVFPLQADVLFANQWLEQL